MKNTITELHKAAQYLAAAGISFIDKKPDDSHTNVGWNTSESRMETHVFGDGFKLGLNLKNQGLEWMKGDTVVSFLDLSNFSHKEIVTWIAEQAIQNNLSKSYSYSFHYDLPYEDVADGHIFTLDKSDLSSISSELTKAQNVFEQFLKLENLESPIRVWPHHFDLGIYAALNAENSFMGAGLAIPDSLVDGLYFYVSGYKNGAAIETKSFGKLQHGEWRSDWNGATLASKDIDGDNALGFLVEAKDKFQEYEG
jgi:hypothetical protein